MSKVANTRRGEGIVQLTLNDPEQQNRLHPAFCAELEEALAELAADPALKVVILAGRSEVFCAGATLKTLQAVAAGTAAVADLELPRRLLEFPLPIIGALEGHAVGGGLVLALCCDMRVACESSRYSMNFADLGFTPGMGATSLLPGLVGNAFASEMFLTAKFYKGRELQGRGLFNYVVPKEQVLSLATDLAQRVAAKPRHVVELLKQALSLPRRQALQEALQREQLMHTICFSRPETATSLELSYGR